MNSTCIRCGKLRIVSKEWTENIGTSLTAFTQEVCPDPKCQKMVEEMLQKKDDRVREIKNQSLLRRAANNKKRTDISLKKRKFAANT